MNPNNYASLETSKRLAEEGIVLETEIVWYEFWHGLDQYYSLSLKNIDHPHIPAPSMAEVWRELPDGTDLTKDKKFTYGLVSKGKMCRCSYDTKQENPTDALIDLLIWVRKEGKK